MSQSSDDELPDLFVEPADFYQKEQEHTNQKYVMRNGETLNLRLVGHNPLWGHLLWNAGRTIATWFEDNPHIVKGKSVLEFGAGAALPSIACTLLGACKVVATDYPDAELIENIRYNIANASTRLDQTRIIAEGFLWGSSAETLLVHLAQPGGFQVLILADVVFNHSEHAKLIQSIKATLHRDGTAYVWFTPYRPWLLEADLKFFASAEQSGLLVEKMFETVLDEVLFKDDPGVSLNICTATRVVHVQTELTIWKGRDIAENCFCLQADLVLRMLRGEARTAPGELPYLPTGWKNWWSTFLSRTNTTKVRTSRMFQARHVEALTLL